MDQFMVNRVVRRITIDVGGCGMIAKRWRGEQVLKEEQKEQKYGYKPEERGKEVCVDESYDNLVRLAQGESRRHCLGYEARS